MFLLALLKNHCCRWGSDKLSELCKASALAWAPRTAPPPAWQARAGATLQKQQFLVSVSKEQGGLVPTGLGFRLKGLQEPFGVLAPTLAHSCSEWPE